MKPYFCLACHEDFFALDYSNNCPKCESTETKKLEEI